MKYSLMCKKCGNTSEPGNYVLKYDKKLDKMIPEYKGTPPVCSKCGEELVFVEEESSIPDFSVSGFKGLPDDEKKKVLRQRFDKEIKRGAGDEKEARKKKAISKMLGHDS